MSRKKPPKKRSGPASSSRWKLGGGATLGKDGGLARPPFKGTARPKKGRC